MTKTKRNILLTFLSFLMIGCALLLSTMTSTIAKANEIYSDDFKVGKEVSVNDDIRNRWIRVMPGGSINFIGNDGEVLVLDIMGPDFIVDGSGMGLPEEIPFVPASEGESYMDYYTDGELLIRLIGNTKINAVSNVYFLDEQEDFVFDTTNFVVDGQIQEWTEIIEKPIRLYVDSTVEITGYNGAYLMSSFEGFSYMATEFAVPTDAPVEIYTCRGADNRGEYVDIFFTRDALNNMFGNSEELMVSAYDVYTLKEELPELPDGPVDEPTDEPSDLPTEEPIETPDNNQGISTEKAIMFGASAILLVAIVAFVISLFKKKK